jgi:lysozyme family protein
MPITLKDALVFTLKWEGTKFTDHPNDPGGPTRYGIIQREYDKYRRAKGIPVRSVNLITEPEYDEIYEKNYWNPVRSEWLSGPLGLTLFDTAVNLGVGGAISRLQAALKIPISGTWTQEISDVIHDVDQTQIALTICNLRIKKRYDRVKQAPSQKVFLQGWLNRDKDLINKVKSLAGLATKFDFEDLSEIDEEFDQNILDQIEKFDEDK